jgi:hypothetical protein
MDELRKLEPFIVKHYSADERPTIKGNGFDGLEIGENREEAEAFVAFINTIAEEAVKQEREACAKLCDERSQWIAGVIVPGLPEQFRGADSFANGSWQEAEACAAAIRARSQEGQG